MQQFRLYSRSHGFYVDLRMNRVGEVWLASADTPDGPSLGWGEYWFNAAGMALIPFEGAITELLHEIPFRQLADRSHEPTTGSQRPGEAGSGV